MPIHLIAVVGAGTMGSGIAQVFAQGGYDVVLHEPSAPVLARARQAMARSLGRFVEKGTLSAAARAAVLDRITFAETFDAVAGSDYVVEAITEDLAAKQALFRQLDALVRPDVILASNTSSIPIATLGAVTSRPDRVLGMHFMNPAPLLPLVEIVRSRDTSPASIGVATALTEAIGKTAVEVADSPGFVANRVLMPMINEAIHALMDGVASAEAIDTVMTLGMNHPIGPLALADLIGLDVCLAILEVMKEGLRDSKFTPCPLLERMVAAGQLGRKSGRGFYDYPPGPAPRADLVRHQ